MKKAFLFTVDAMIASIILISSILLFSNLYIEENANTHLGLMSNDMLNVLSELKVREINNSYLNYLIAEGEISNMNNTLIEQIGELWALNKTGHATNLTRNLTHGLFPTNLGFSIALGDEELFRREFSTQNEVIAARKMISGYEKNRPIKGSTSRAYLKSIREKKYSSFAYFGGFVGQGNISKKLEYIPSDAVIESAFIELDAGTNFDAYINNNLCDSLVPIKGNMTSTRWNISNCTPLFIEGTENNISIIFKGLLNESFIGGGYSKVEYRTKELIRNTTQGIEYFYLPGITGLINLYSSFDIPGTLNSIDIFIHFYNNKTTYLNIGNETIFTALGSSVDQIVNISGYTLPLAPQTIPIRMGIGNISESINVTSGEPSDSVLVTDVSGSMDECGEYSEIELCRYQCRVCWWWFCWWEWEECPYGGSCSEDQCGSCSSETTRNHEIINDSVCLKTKMVLAKEADMQFVDIVLNLTGNEIGLVSYDSSVDSVEPITNIEINLENEINDYNASGGTCICCGINRAKNMLSPSTDKKFMVVMSDGEANYYCTDFDDYTGTYDNVPGRPTAISSAINAGQNACSLGMTVFTVGFGADADHGTLKQIACNESLYYNASDAANITEIYRAIGEQILVIANYSSQIIAVEGGYEPSILYPDSYLKFNFTPMVSPPSFGEIEIVLETDKFNSSPNTINIPQKIRLIDAKVLSYSGHHWTSFMSINSNQIFNISEFGSDYEDLGDPFVLRVIPSNLNNGDNQIELQTADTPENNTGISKNNSMIYTAAVKSSISYSSVLPYAEGCEWTIENEDSELINIPVPIDYAGNKSCNYTNSSISFNDQDSIDQSVYDLLSNLDFDNNGKININIDDEDLEIEALWVSQVPYLWGPAIIEVRVWQ